VDITYGREFLAGRYRPGARDQRLEEFAQGRWGDAARPSSWLASGWLALQASDVSRPEVLAEATGDELLGVGRAWKSLETWSFCGKLAVVRELIRRFPLNEDDEPGAEAGGLPDEWDPRLHHEVAAALGISVVAAGKMVNLAWTLEARLPGISEALADGRLDPGRVKMIVDETAVLDREDLFGRAEAIILAGLRGCKTWSDLQRLVQRAVITVDPDGARRRRERAEREDARVRFWREAAGTCALRGTGLPTDQALAATANIEARALEYKAAPVKRRMDILRVMAYLDLINGVTVAQRAAWARAEDAARAAGADQTEADQTGADQTEADGQAARDTRLRDAAAQARDKVREKARARAGQRDANPGRPGQGEDADDGRPGDAHDGSANGDGPGDGRPDGGGDGGGPDGTGGGVPGGDGPDGGAGGGGPGDGRPDGGSDGGGEGRGDGRLPQGYWIGSSPGGYPRGGQAPGNLAPGGQAPGTLARGDHALGGLPCTLCGVGVGGVCGLPIRASLTLPAGAVQWLAEGAGGWRGFAGTPDGTPDGTGGGSSSGGGGTGAGGGGGGGDPGGGGSGDRGPCPASGNQGSGRMPGTPVLPVRGNLTFPLLTLLGLAERPGEAHGMGALDAGLVRDLAAAGARHPASEFCVTITDERGFAIGHGCAKPIRGRPVRSKGAAIPAGLDRVSFTPAGRTGPNGGFGAWTLTVPGAPAPFTVDIGPVPVDDCDHRHASAGYAPSARLRHLVQVRDGACSFPACSRHARDCDFEHAQSFDAGGPTCACNAHACSRACHRIKQSPGWTVTKPRPGWTQWTTMTGRTYRQGPWRYPA
jgi:uncharacterized protein DUF222